MYINLQALENFLDQGLPTRSSAGGTGPRVFIIYGSYVIPNPTAYKMNAWDGIHACIALGLSI